MGHMQGQKTCHSTSRSVLHTAARGQPRTALFGQQRRPFQPSGFLQKELPKTSKDSCQHGKYFKKHVRFKDTTCSCGHVASSIQVQDCFGMGSPDDLLRIKVDVTIEFSISCAWNERKFIEFVVHSNLIVKDEFNIASEFFIPCMWLEKKFMSPIRYAMHSNELVENQCSQFIGHSLEPNPTLGDKTMEEVTIAEAARYLMCKMDKPSSGEMENFVFSKERGRIG
ncbi:hypothetical protein KI387_038251, partial [Taxus chinensis]